MLSSSRLHAQAATWQGPTMAVKLMQTWVWCDLSAQLQLFGVSNSGMCSTLHAKGNAVRG